MMAARALSFSGTATYEQTGVLSTLRVVHAPREARFRERVEYLDGPPGGVVRENARPGCADPQETDAVLDRATAIGRAAMVEHYLASFLDDTRIAGRPVARIQLQPRDEYRFGRVLGIDRQTGVMLQTLIFDHQGRILERFQFSDIAIGGPGEADDRDLEPADRQLSGSSVCELGGQPSARRWRTTWVPPGFVALPTRRTDMQHFTDGFSSLSVFVDSDAAAAPLVEARRGPTVAFLRQVEDAVGAGWICVIGEVPLRTARRIAAGIELNREEAAADQAAGEL